LLLIDYPHGSLIPHALSHSYLHRIELFADGFLTLQKSSGSTDHTGTLTRQDPVFLDSDSRQSTSHGQYHQECQVRE
jgi:hypothetical protein